MLVGITIGSGIFRVPSVVAADHTPYVALLLYMLLGIVGVTTHTFEQLAQIFVVPIAFLLVSAAMLVNGVLQRPADTAVSLGVLLLGLPAYYGRRALQTRSARRDNADR